MHVGWTREYLGVFSGIDGDGNGPTSVRGTLMDAEEVQLAGDGELFIRSPYEDWKPDETRVINYMLARQLNDVQIPANVRLLRLGWRTATTARKAREEVEREFGRILEENAAGDHVFFRVYKERK